jgi:amino acid permease
MHTRPCAVGLAEAVPHVGLIISLVGAFGGAMIALICPSLIYLLFRRAHAIETGTSVPTYIYVPQAIVIVFGVVGMISGTYVNMRDIINTF